MTGRNTVFAAGECVEGSIVSFFATCCSNGTSAAPSHNIISLLISLVLGLPMF